MEVLDFARWLQMQLAPDEESRDRAAPVEMKPKEKAWEQTYLANRDDFRAMAHQALADLDVGETLGMVIAGGKVPVR